MASAQEPSQRAPYTVRTRNYLRHLWTTLAEAPFTSGTWLYLVIVVVGVAVATWLIPFINSSETSPETLGIYVIGILIAVFADALFLWKKSKDDAIAETIAAVSFALCFCVGFLSIKEQLFSPDGLPIKRWKPYGEFVLYLILVLSIFMWAMINVVEPRLDVAATQEPADFNRLSGQ